MAHISFIVEDNENGSVFVKCTPGAETLFDKWKRKVSMTPAECMALAALSALINSDANAPVIEARSNAKKPLIIQG